MENRVFTSSNGLTMVESKLFNWQRQSVYYDKEVPYYYYIYTGNMEGGFGCHFSEENSTLTITHTSSSSVPAHFKVKNIEAADSIVLALLEGEKRSLAGTIYEKPLSKVFNKIITELEL